MSKFKKVFGAISSILGLAPPKAPAITIPPPAIPAPPAPAPLTDTGASVFIGSSTDIKNQRVSGRSAGRSSGVMDVIGGLGRSGLKL